MLSSRDETKKWSVDKDMVMSHTKAQSLELSSTDNGVLLNRVTTAQMNAIASPTTNEIVYNTELNALYRYDGANWVALSAGYGLIEVIRDSDNGVPTYFSDLQTALDTCKTGTNTVILYDNIILTSEADLTISSGFNFTKLTIDFNGFTITNAQANTESTLNFDRDSVNSELLLLNGVLSRVNGTSTAAKCMPVMYNVSMSNMTFYCDNYKVTQFLSPVDKDLGGSTFIGGGSQTTIDFYDSEYSNFTSVATGSGKAIAVTSGAKLSRFKTKSNSGEALNINSTSEALLFNAYSNSNYAVNNSGKASVFYAESNSGDAVIDDGAITSNFTCVSNTGRALYAASQAEVSNFTAINNSSTKETVFVQNANKVVNGDAINNSSNYAYEFSVNQSNRNYSYSNLNAISIGGVGAYVNCSTPITITKSEFSSRLDTSSGHALQLNTTSNKLIDCILKVVNSSANGVYATSSVTAKIANCSFDGATTPINANITVSASTDLGNGNRQL
jgi:hypothetical protein